MTDPLRLIRKVTAPVRRINRAEDDLDDYMRRHKRLIVVIDNGYRAGENYIRKVAAMDMGAMLGLYGDDVIMAYNSYKRAMKAKQNGNITDRGAIPATTAKKQPIGFQQKI